MTDLLPLLQEFHREKLALMLEHQAAARVAAQYDINNSYQYILNRDEVHLSWLAAAIAELGGQPADGGPTEARRGDQILQEDARAAQTFVDRWRPRVERMTSDRHKKMLQVILGDTLEQKRFYEQALAGRTDLLGRRADVLGPSYGEVLPTRWIE